MHNNAMLEIHQGVTNQIRQDQSTTVYLQNCESFNETSGEFLNNDVVIEARTEDMRNLKAKSVHNKSTERTIARDHCETTCRYLMGSRTGQRRRHANGML